jgi:hypothetical protein
MRQPGRGKNRHWGGMEAIILESVEMRRDPRNRLAAIGMKASASEGEAGVWPGKAGLNA